MKYYVVDAFASELFKGNPAGVCLLEKELNDETMQSIAAENNLAETAFLLKKGNEYSLRWFTPETEIDLCGHATLATAFVLMNYVETGLVSVEFQTQSGTLIVTREEDFYVMDFPSRGPISCEIPAELQDALGVKVLEMYLSRDYLVLVENEAAVTNLNPDFSLMKTIDDAFAVIVTAKGDTCDFVSRFFAPNAGINEDPVTGSAHCTLIPFWSKRLNKKTMLARQLSKRGGVIYCEDNGERVKIGGKAICYSVGEIHI